MKIGLDVLGGDYAPNSTIFGAIEAQKNTQRRSTSSSYWRSAGHRRTVETGWSKPR